MKTENTELMELQRRIHDLHESSHNLRNRIKDLEDQLKRQKELREGDNMLILALAEGAGIKITCNPKLMGLVWEQFYDGVMDMKRKIEE